MRTLFKKIGIRGKIGIIFGIILIVFLGIFFYSSYLLNKMTKETELLVKESTMVETVLEIRRHEKNLILRGNDAKFMGQIRYSELVNSLLAQLSSAVQDYKTFAPSDRLRGIEDLSKQLTLYRVSFNRFVQSLNDAAPRQESEELIVSGRALLTHCKEIEERTLLAIDHYKEQITLSRGVIVFSFLAAGLITFWLISHSVVIPVRKLQQLSREMGKAGVLKPGQIKFMDEAIKEISSTDEMGELARAYRTMLISYYNSYWGLQEKMHEAEELSRVKVEFASMVSHELRTPLTAIKEVVDLLFYEISGPLKKDQKDFLKIAKRNIDRLSRLINDILNFSKSSSRKVELKIEKVAVNDVIESVIRSHAITAEKKGVHLTAHLHATKDLVIASDADRLNQVVTNLIHNAVKFTDEGNIRVTTLIEEKAHLLKVSVEDTGEGIPEEDIPKLFEPFTQVGESRKKKREGTGLGLTVCKLIIEQLGGKIWVESSPGKGSRFFFTLPIERAV